VRIDATEELTPLLEQHSLDAKVQILDGEKIIAEALLGFKAEYRPLQAACVYLDQIPEYLLADPSYLDRLRVRIVGTSELAFSNLRRDACWVGSFEEPLRSLLVDR
jgi:hypothetical protein